MKPIYFLMTVAGVGGSIVAQLVGGWTYALTVLCILMALDYLSGLIVAGVFHASPKSQGGGLESRAGLKGLLRKFAIVIVVVVAHLMDGLIGTDYLRDGCAIAFCLNEIISLIENLGLMGAPIPAVIMKGIDILKTKVVPESATEEVQKEQTGTERLAAAAELLAAALAAEAEAKDALDARAAKDGRVLILNTVEGEEVEDPPDEDYVEAVGDGWPADETEVEGNG